MQLPFARVTLCPGVLRLFCEEEPSAFAQPQPHRYDACVCDADRGCYNIVAAKFTGFTLARSWVAGFTNAHIQGILRKLLDTASSKRYLRILKIGPPVSGQGHGGSQDSEAGQLDVQTSQALCSLLASHHSLQLLVVWGVEGELADTIIHAGLQAGLEREETGTGCLRLKRL